MATIAIGVSPTKDGSYICRVPLSSLEEDGTPPEEGDTVNYSVEGTVQSVSGDTATVKIDSVNGEPVGEESEESPEEESQEEGGGPPPGAGGGPSGGASGADGLGRPLGVPVARRRMPLGGLVTPTGETTAQMGKRLRKSARGQALPF